LVKMYRQAESGKADGLDNHNAANAEGVSQYINMRTRSKCIVQLFHVHVCHRDLHGQVTPGSGYKSYANYQSCDDHGGGKYKCTPIGLQDCAWLKLSPSTCQSAHAHDAKTDDAKTHVGMGKQRTGSAMVYSLPKAGVHTNWHREKHFRQTKCWKGMKASEIEHAFKKLALKAWNSGDLELMDSELSANIMSETMLV